MGNWERLVWNQRDVLLAGLARHGRGLRHRVRRRRSSAGLALCLMRLYVRAAAAGRDRC